MYTMILWSGIWIVTNFDKYLNYISFSKTIWAPYLETRAPRGTDCSPEYNEHFFYKQDYPPPPPPPTLNLFLPHLDPPLGRYGRNILLQVQGHEHYIPTKFHKHPLSGSVVKADYAFPYIYMH